MNDLNKEAERAAPCPLCESQQVQICRDSNNPAKDSARCRKCKCTAPLSVWNRRAAPIVGDDGLPPLPASWRDRSWSHAAPSELDAEDHTKQLLAEIEDWRAWAEQVRQAQRDAIAPYVERIRVLEREDVGPAAAALLQYIDEHDWGGIPEGATADRLRAALAGNLHKFGKKSLQAVQDVKPWRERLYLGYEECDQREAMEAEIAELRYAIAADRAARAQQQAQSVGDDPEFQELAGDVYRAGAYNESIEKSLNALIAYINGRTAGVAPEGWRLVPVEPTNEMLRVSLATEWSAIYKRALYEPMDGPMMRADTDKRVALAAKRYAAMLAAAPSPQPGKEGA